jgi:AAA ATPase domain
MNAMPATPETSDPAGLTGLLTRIQTSNPFLDNRINGPSSNDADVAEIHQNAFHRLTSLAGEALAAGRGLGAVLWGEAGIGKSHLLSRMARWAEGRASFVYLHNLQASPDSLPRSLLRAVISLLTHGHTRQPNRIPLFHMIRETVLANLPEGESVFPVPQVEQAYEQWIDQLGGTDLPGSTLLDRTVYDVLFRFFRAVCEWRSTGGQRKVAEAALHWLAGQALDPDEASLLHLPPSPRSDEPVALADNQQIKQVLVAITRLAAARQRPFLLAFDQVDNLDAEQFAALGRFLEALIDSSPNLLVILAGVQASLLDWREKRVIQDSAWDRVAQVKVQLGRIGASDAEQMVRTRLQRFLEPFSGLPLVVAHRTSEPLFPLPPEWYKQHLQDHVDLRPRDVVNHACEGWRELQDKVRREGGRWLLPASKIVANGPPPSPQPLTEAEIEERRGRRVRESLADLLASRQREPGGLPADEDRLIRLIEDLVRSCRNVVPGYGVLGVDRGVRRGAALPPHQLEITRQGSAEETVFRTGLLCVTAVSRIAVAGYLRRLMSGPGRVDRQILLTDARIGLRLGPQGEKYMVTLEQLGPQRFLRLEVSFVEYAELDALHSVIGLSRNGELELDLGTEKRTLTEKEVIESLHQQGRFRASRLLRELLDPVGQDKDKE